MKALLDVNFPPRLASELTALGLSTRHWTEVGRATASDHEILAWARTHSHVVVSQDLDYAEILATTGAESPSVLLVRDADAMSAELSRRIFDALQHCADALAEGAIAVVTIRGLRVRVLPIR